MTKYFLISVYCLFTLLITSCNKDNDGMDEMRDRAKLIFVNAAPDSRASVGGRSLGLFANFNGADDVIQPLQFPWTSAYLAYTPGQYTIRIDTARAANGTIPGARATVLTVNANLEADRYYSLFAIDSAQKPTYLLLNDDLSLPTNGKVKVRFMNLSPDAGTIDVVNGNTGTVLAGSLAYKQNPVFVEIDPVDLPNVRIRDNATGTLISPNNRRILLERNNVYTIWASGLRNPSPGVSHTLRLNYIANRYSFE